MSDKKSCENCAGGLWAGCVTEKKPCEHYRRNPSLWLAIPPSESGWYWLKNWLIEIKFPEHPEKMVVEIVAGGRGGKQVLFLGTEIYYDLQKIKGQWQGPITPQEDKQ
jgi:hypothetical protein